MINPLSTSLSGLIASAKKAGVAASNIANASTSGSLDGAVQPYEAQTTVTSSVAGGGVKAVSISKDPAFVPSYEPDSPFANGDGMVASPNVNLDEELITLKAAEMAYKANAQVLRVTSDLQEELTRALDKKV